jgi:hypothetical protein
VGAVAWVALVACGTTGPSARQDRTAAVYSAILRTIVPPATEKPVVFVAPFPEQKSVPIETQAAVIGSLGDDFKVRFVDALSEAVDTGTAGAPAKDGIVVVLGAVPTAGNSVEVEAERYQSEDAHTSIRFRVNAVDDRWSAEVVSEQPVPPTTSP